MTARPTTHAEDCPLREPTEAYEACTCALPERQRIHDLERQVERIPNVGEPERGESHVTWRDDSESGVSVWRGSILITYPANGPTPKEARWLAAALLAAADEAEDAELEKAASAASSPTNR